MRKASQMVAKVLQELKERVKPGKTTMELNRYAEHRIKELGGKPAFKGYRGFPECLCVSINDEVVHGIPSSVRRIQDGDLVSLDFAAFYEGYCGDAAITVPVGEVSEDAKSLMRVTQAALYEGIAQGRTGGRLGDVSSAIQRYVEKEGFSVVREMVGHGIGKKMHEEPHVPNFGEPGTGPELKSGMTLAIEPMVNAGSYQIKFMEDGWTVKTVDGSLSAHFEHTIVVTANGPEILTTGEFIG